MRTRVRNESGFILPLAVLLVLILTISGTSLMQHDFLERRMAMNTVDNHDSFYLANAGIERARDTLRITTPGIPVWTTVLASYPDDTNRVNNPLCPTDPTLKCIKLFGDTVTAPNIPFAGTFSDGQYEVRAFNDGAPGETGTVDNNGLLIVRARGTIARGAAPGEQKLLEITAVSTRFGLLNCEDDTDAPCPDEPAPDKNQPTLTHLPGRESQSIPSSAFPTPDFTYYQDPSHFVGLTSCGAYTGGAPTSGCLYINSGPVDITASGGSSPQGNPQLVFFSTGNITASGNITLMNTILVSQGSIDLQGHVTLSAPTSQNYPAIIASVTFKGDSSVTVTGNVYATSIGEDAGHPLNPVNFHGLLFGNDIYLKSGTSVNDDGNLAFYGRMPGFTITNQSETAGIKKGSWREIQ